MNFKAAHTAPFNGGKSYETSNHDSQDAGRGSIRDHYTARDTLA